MDNISIDKIFGSNVFGDSVMKERLPKDTYIALKDAVVSGKSIDSSIADTVALAMKEWAIEKGATHFTHWFQPMTGITAEKHDSFIAPTGDGHIIMDFSGKELIKGEPDASSFPSGGLRATFEARGYTAWDPSSFAFVKDKTLCIPTAFCSFGGEALDQKTPLLRSMDAIGKQALRIVKLFGMDDVTSVRTTAGPEQEYFLVDKTLYDKRPDLMYCGRTLIGAVPPKGQEMNDHYFGVIKSRVSEFMKELDIELWKLGVLAKTEHNEAAPAQHELAPIYSTTNIAADHNQITMELMKKIAAKHDLVCILHEKPFKGLNGSGKHNNWSLATDTGINLLKPGKNPSENKLFLLCLAAVVKAVDEHQDLLRISVATAGNDHRLGSAEAPPAIVSMFLGEELTAILTAIEEGRSYDKRDSKYMSIGTNVIPSISKDNTDRNRTSPFAFTGDKFEFRMLGSASSISDANVMLNTMVADTFALFADRLEKAEDFDSEVMEIIRESVHEHKRIIFNGDGYSKEWKEEAKRRGLLSLKSTPDAIPFLCKKNNVDMFVRYGVFNEVEMHCRGDIALENYCKTIHIEALTLIEMVKRDIIPAVSRAIKEFCDTIENRRKVLTVTKTSAEEKIVKELYDNNEKLFALVTELEKTVEDSQNLTDVHKRAVNYHDGVLSVMESIRAVCDSIETFMPRNLWPYPTYGDLLFKI